MKKTTHEFYKRVEVPVVYNENTKQLFQEIEKIIVTYFSGYTRIHSDRGGVWRDEDGKVYRENTVIFIIYYNEDALPEAEKQLESIAELLLQHEEQACLVCSHTVAYSFFTKQGSSELGEFEQSK